MFSCEVVAVEKGLCPKCAWKHSLPGIVSPLVFAFAAHKGSRSLSIFFSFSFVCKGDKLILTLLTKTGCYK